MAEHQEQPAARFARPSLAADYERNVRCAFIFGSKIGFAHPTVIVISTGMLRMISPCLMKVADRNPLRCRNLQQARKLEKVPQQCSIEIQLKAFHPPSFFPVFIRPLVLHYPLRPSSLCPSPHLPVWLG
jgi:hypothetical protein